jgi:hypothetical protein
MLDGLAIFENHSFRKEELRKRAADFTYKSLPGTIFKNRGLRVGRE